MSNRTDKNILKQYFRSGSRPTQNQFHELIENCYNQNVFTSWVPGYQLFVSSGEGHEIHSHIREGGRSRIIPGFGRINIPHRRVFHYAIPVANLGDGFMLDRVLIEMALPGNSTYDVQDKRDRVHISQTVKIDAIHIYNGTEEVYADATDTAEGESVYELEIGALSDQWRGINIDIAVEYDIRSEIAVSDQLDISTSNPDMLEHRFGSAGCIFIQND